MIIIKAQGTKFRVSYGMGLGAHGDAVTANNEMEVNVAVSHFLGVPHTARCCPVHREDAARAARNAQAAVRS